MCEVFDQFCVRVVCHDYFLRTEYSCYEAREACPGAEFEDRFTIDQGGGVLLKVGGEDLAAVP